MSSGELTLIPLFFLIDRWGGKNRHGAALNFVLYTMGGSVFMLLSLLVLFDTLPGHSFAMDQMSAGAKQLAEHKQVLIFLGFLVGFGVKMPIFPIHGWLPLAHVEAPHPNKNPALWNPVEDGRLRPDPRRPKELALPHEGAGSINATGSAGGTGPGQPDLRRPASLAPVGSEKDDRLLLGRPHGGSAARHRHPQHLRANRPQCCR